jgi:hypothetical protein
MSFRFDCLFTPSRQLSRSRWPCRPRTTLRRALPDGIPLGGAIQGDRCEFTHHPEADGQTASPDPTASAWNGALSPVLGTRERSVTFFINDRNLFTWFSSLPAYSICGWEPLEWKFYEHFYSDNSEAKLGDLTSVRQSCDESILYYFKQFKEIKNWCFNLTIS